jgi:RNA polymerase sigma factor (sigma-70 family)
MNTLMKQLRRELSDRLADVCQGFRFRWPYPSSWGDGEVEVAAFQEEDGGPPKLVVGITCSLRLMPALRGFRWAVYNVPSGERVGHGLEHRGNHFCLRDLPAGEYRVDLTPLPSAVEQPDSGAHSVDQSTRARDRDSEEYPVGRTQPPSAGEQARVGTGDAVASAAALDQRAMTTLARPLPPEEKKPITEAQAARAARRARLLARKSAALDGIIARHWKPLLAYTLRRLAGRADAPDVAREVVQDVFFTLVALPGKAKSFCLGRPLRPWLKNLARREVISYFRRLRHRQLPGTFEAPVADRAPSPLQALLEKEERLYLAWLVKLLPRPYRRVFRDHYIRDLSVQEVVKATGRSQGEVYAALRECQRYLQEAGHLDLREKVRRAALRLRRVLARRWRAGRWAVLLSRVAVQVRADEDTINRAWRGLARLRARVVKKRTRSVRRVTAELQALCDEVCGDTAPGV